MSTRLPHYDRGSQLLVRRGKSGYTVIFFMVFTEFLLKNRRTCSANTGIADDAHIPSSERIVIERHRALLVVGNIVYL